MKVFNKITYIFFFAALSYVAVSFFCTSDAWAQAKGGVFEPSAVSRRPVKLPEVEFEFDNVYLHDLLRLQKQIALIEKLTERESKISDIISAYQEMGVDIDFPAPNRDWCEQIPANLACAYHYPQMYEGFDSKALLEPEAVQKPQIKKSGGKEPVAMPPRNPLEGLDFIPKNVADQSEEEKDLLKEVTFVWTKINCLKVQCRAVISPLQEHTNEEGKTQKKVMKKLRYTIRPGDTLPDGRMVDKISATGVTLKDKNGDMSQIRPAPQ